MTCTDTSSPTRRAAAAPASVAAFTAPTSPRTITVTYPAPIYSLPIRRTLAAFTMASAASTAPMRPLVSISPNASCDMARTLTDLRQMRQLNYHQRPLFFSPAVRSVARRLLLMTVSAPCRSLGIFIALVGAIAPTAAGCRNREPPAPPVASPSVRINHDKAPLGSPIEITYKFVVQNTGAIDQDYRVMAHVVDTDEELMWTDDHNPPVPTTQWKQGQ